VKHALSRIAGLAAEWLRAAVVTDPIDDRARSLYRGFEIETPIPKFATNNAERGGGKPPAIRPATVPLTPFPPLSHHSCRSGERRATKVGLRSRVTSAIANA
jgi:hypothetical protein